VIEALKAYAKAYPGTSSAEAALDALKAFEKGGNVFSAAVRRQINQALDLATKAGQGEI
jgi:tRNA threonylcarbamoyladenosine modification (KEOPS) complex Cgi121 subunit